MYCRWWLIMMIWMVYIFNFWPFKRKWLETTHPLVKGTILTGVSVVILIALIKGFFEYLLGNYGLAYFNRNSLKTPRRDKLLRHRVLGAGHPDVRGHRKLALARMGRGL